MRCFLGDLSKFAAYPLALFPSKHAKNGYTPTKGKNNSNRKNRYSHHQQNQKQNKDLYTSPKTGVAPPPPPADQKNMKRPTHKFSASSPGRWCRSGHLRPWDGSEGKHWLWVKTNGIPFWLVGEFTAHFRTHFSGLGCSPQIRDFDPLPNLSSTQVRTDSNVGQTNKSLFPYQGAFRGFLPYPWFCLCPC